MRMQNAFQEERDLLCQAFYLSLNWRTFACQVAGLIGALFFVSLFAVFGAEATRNGWVALSCVLTLIGAGVAYCWMSVANSMVIKITDERLLGHLGVSTGLLKRFLKEHLASVLLMSAICYGIVLAVILLLSILQAIGDIPYVGPFFVSVLIVPMFVIALFGFLVGYIGLFELPALTGGEQTTPRENLAELSLMIRRSFSRLFFRHTLAILGAFLIAVPLCTVAVGSISLMLWVSSRVLQHDMAFYAERFRLMSGVVASASLGVIGASVFAFPVSFLSIASFLIYRAANETIDEERGAYLE